MEQLSEGQKLHHILEYLCNEKKERRKGSCDTDEIANSFDPPLKVAEVNVLCKRLMQEDDVKDCSTKDNINNIGVLYIRATQDAYETEKYLTEIDKIKYNFNLFIRTSEGPYNIINLKKEKLHVVIDAYINGKKNFFINGEKYNLESINTICIYTYEKQVNSDKLLDHCIRNGTATEYFYEIYYLEPNILALYGEDVTADFIGDNEYGGQNIRTSTVTFVNPSRINELKLIRSDKFDLTRLVQLCKEINDNYQNENYLSVGMIGRTILHHIPPIFGCSNFSEAANNYAKGSFKKNMLHLENTISICDALLHQPIRKIETLPTKQQVNFIQDLDRLIEEIVLVLKK